MPSFLTIPVSKVKMICGILTSVKFVSVDPGESCGYAVWVDGELQEAGTAELWEFVHAAGAVHGIGLRDGLDPELLSRLEGFQELVIEDWALYPWKLKEMGWDKCRTARAIGALQFICRVAMVPYKLQDADIKDTAKAAGAGDLFLRPLYENRHANDAIMHGVVRNLQGA